MGWGVGGRHQSAASSVMARALVVLVVLTARCTGAMWVEKTVAGRDRDSVSGLSRRVAMTQSRPGGGCVVGSGKMGIMTRRGNSAQAAEYTRGGDRDDGRGEGGNGVNGGLKNWVPFKRRVLQDLTREESITDEQSFAIGLLTANTTPHIVLRLKADIILTRDLPLVDPVANVTLLGACVSRRCIIYGGRTIFSNQTYGSLRVFDIVFQNISTIFLNVNLTLKNCDFRTCGKFRLIYIPTMAGNPRPLLVDNCSFIDNFGGIVLDNIGERTCMSNSVFSSVWNDAPALQINVGPGFVDRLVTVSGSVFNSTKGGAVISFQDPGKSVEVVFKDTVFVGGRSSNYEFVIVLNSTRRISSRAFASSPSILGTGRQTVRLCRANFTYEENRRDDVKVETPGEPMMPVNLELCGNDSLPLPSVLSDPMVNTSTSCSNCDPAPPCISEDYDNTHQDSGEREKRIGMMVGGVIGISAIFVLVLGVLVYVRREWRAERKSVDHKNSKNSDDHNQHENLQRLRIFTLKSLQVATEDFGTMIGEGGSASVYKGHLKTGEIVAVKALKAGYWRSEKEFVHEVELLGKLNHKNLVNLIGYCIENNRFFLVYEFVARGNLHDHIHKGSRSSLDLDWGARFKIAFEVATALEYLHHLLEYPLVHRDIKPGNVLLTQNLTAKVADFGLCRTIDNSENGALETRAAGTPGYVPPEIFMGESATEKVDVFGFGVLLLEILTGKYAVQRNFSLVNWVLSSVTDEESAVLACDPAIQDAIDGGQMFIMMQIARFCVDEDPEKRPTMKNVVRAFEKVLPNVPDSILVDVDVKSEGSIDTPRGRSVENRSLITGGTTEWELRTESPLRAVTLAEISKIIEGR